jgi:predicted lipoprotein with Yx(FWY)xxD motif
MIDLTTTQRRVALIAPAAVAGLLLTACGSGSGYGSGPTGGSSSSDGGAEQIATATGQYGTYLTADGGKAVYLWLGDSGSTSNCSSACASAWPPVLTTGAPTAASGAVAADLGTTKRSDGSTQVTYHGHPLYYFAGDSGTGETNGQGNNGFGAKWWLVSPAGTGITANGSSGSSSGSSSSSGGYGY